MAHDTGDIKNALPVPAQVIEVKLSFDDRARALLNDSEYASLNKYIESGGKQLAPEKSSRFFEMFLNGSTTREIHEYNKAFPYDSIVWARIKDEWDTQKDDYLKKLQEGIKDKLIKAKLEAAGLMADVLIVASKQQGEKLKKYLATGDVSHLKDSIAVDSLYSLQKAVESLAKITGEDRNVKVTKEEKVDVSVSVAAGEASLSTEAAAQVLAIVAADKRSKNAKGSQ